MQLSEALGLREKELVAVVGAGGKTTIVFGLARELAGLGKRVVVTTTTMILEPVPEDRFELVLSKELRAAKPKLESLLRSGGVAILARSRVEETSPSSVVGKWPNRVGPLVKLKGIPPDWADELRLERWVDYTIAEADGARGRSLKAPADHEPVMPAGTTMAVVVAGVDVVGKKLGREAVHRPERVAEILGLRLEAEVTPEAVAAILVHPEGGLKGVPLRAKVVVMLNKVESELEASLARRIGELALLSPQVDRVLVGAARREPPVAEVMRR